MIPSLKKSWLARSHTRKIRLDEEFKYIWKLHAQHHQHHLQIFKRSSSICFFFFYLLFLLYLLDYSNIDTYNIIEKNYQPPKKKWQKFKRKKTKQHISSLFQIYLSLSFYHLTWWLGNQKHHSINKLTGIMKKIFFLFLKKKLLWIEQLEFLDKNKLLIKMIFNEFVLKNITLFTWG